MLFIVISPCNTCPWSKLSSAAKQKLKFVNFAEQQEPLRKEQELDKCVCVSVCVCEAKQKYLLLDKSNYLVIAFLGFVSHGYGELIVFTQYLGMEMYKYESSL